MKRYTWFIAIISTLLLLCLSACAKPSAPTVIAPTIEEEVKTIDTSVPAGYDAHREDVEYGTVQELTYSSTVTGGQKHANVLLPAHYDATKSYPVVFMYPGHGSDHNYWLSDLNAAEIYGNMMHDGLLSECIVVFVNFFMTPTEESAGDIRLFNHDSSAEDVVDCLYPALALAYNIKKGKTNTAVAGYSNGGRATLNLALRYPDFVDYALACEPFYYDETKCVLAGKSLKSFYLVKGTKDGIVVDAPYRVHLDLQKYHVDHTYIELELGHEPACWKQSLYLYLNTIFKE